MLNTVSSRNYIFNHAIRIADVLHGMFGKRCEVAVHDFSDLDHSLIHLAGKLTGRTVGAPITDLVLHVIQEKENDEIQDLINYHTAKDGIQMKSSTAFLHDHDGQVIGALCINFQIDGLFQLTKELEEFVSFSREVENRTESFPTTVQEVVEEIVTRTIAEMGINLDLISVERKVELARILEQRGVFLIKGAVDYVAGLLSISKYTLYSYLQKVKARNLFKHEGER